MTDKQKPTVAAESEISRPWMMDEWIDNANHWLETQPHEAVPVTPAGLLLLLETVRAYRKDEVDRLKETMKWDGRAYAHVVEMFTEAREDNGRLRALVAEAADETERLRAALYEHKQMAADAEGWAKSEILRLRSENGELWYKAGENAAEIERLSAAIVDMARFLDPAGADLVASDTCAVIAECVIGRAP